MKIILLVSIIILNLVSTANSQNNSSDSLRLGRNCKIVLYNGFQAEGKIVNRGSDTITLQTDVTRHDIPVNGIKFVLNPEIELSDVEENPTGKYEELNIETVRIDTTEYCDIYMDDKSSYLNVRVILDTDTTIRVVKDNRSKTVNIAGIRKMEFKPSAPFGKGYFIGSLVGIGIGLVTGLSISGGHGSIGFPGLIAFCFLASIPAGLVGGVIGAITAKNEMYLFEKGLKANKIKRIEFIIKKHIDT
ncbi:MAG TPA: hypothetical protein PKE39_11435 [Ignavibacteria bacterium]|nr:hypothetical protein [Ignavibacteria bacterium]